MNTKVSPYPIPELKEFLRPFRQHFYRAQSLLTTPLARLAELTHRRPGVERGCQDGKGFTGLDAYAARKWDSFHRHLAIDMLVLSWLALQRPPVENPVIVLEPQAVQSPNEPLFPYRPEPYRSIGPIWRSLRVPVGRTGAMVGVYRSGECLYLARPPAVSGERSATGPPTWP